MKFKQWRSEVKQLTKTLILPHLPHLSWRSYLNPPHYEDMETLEKQRKTSDLLFISHVIY